MSDTNHRNVVHFDKHGKADHQGASLISECRNMASEKLAGSLSDMMGRVDDALFELAEKAENNIEQSHYFDAMRDVRLKRASIESEFRKQLIERCNLDTPPEAEAAAPQVDSGLSLIEDNLLETSLAVSNMVAKANYLCKEELFALEQRIAYLLRRDRADETVNPLDPVNICNAFKDACHELDSDIKVKLIILKLFEKFVIKDLKVIYQAINEFLARNNVLPVINYAIRNNTAAEAALDEVMTEAALADDGGQAGKDLLASLRELLGGRAAHPGPGAPLAGAPGAVPGMPLVSSGEMLSNLTQLQRGIPGHFFEEAVHFDATRVTSGTINVLRELQALNVFGGLPEQDDHTIDIVAMLFDYILDDRNIPDRMKAIIGRLQIPILKVVMMDRSFFSRKRHPARGLLDALSRAALGFDEEGDEITEAVYAKAEAVVQRILNEFEDDPGIFQEVLDETEAFLEEMGRKCEEKIEQTRRELEQQTLHHNAGIIANQEVRKRIDTADIDPLVREFLNEYWSRLLMIAYLRDGGDLHALRPHVETMDTLIWSVLPKNTPEERRRLVDMLPGLLRELNAGMDALEVEDDERESFFARLALCHSKAVSHRTRSPGAAEVPHGDEETGDRAGQDIPPSCEARPRETASQTAPGEAPRPPRSEPSPPEPGKPACASDIMAQIEQGVVEVEEITLGNGPDTPPAAHEADEFTEQARKLAKGSWLAFKKEDGALSHEKLLWINSVTQMYMFTNRNGHNTRNLDLHQLAAMFRSGRATALQEEELVERAVNDLVITLRRG